MYIFVLALFVTIGMLAAFPSSAQPKEPAEFVPGELIVGFSSPEARDKAIADLRRVESQGGMRSGEATSSTLNVEPIDETSVKLQFDFVVTRGNERSKPTKTEERRILQEAADFLKQSDQRVTYAHPNWVVQIKRERVQEPVLLSKRVEPTVQAAARSSHRPNDPIFERGLQWDYLAPANGMNALGAWELDADGKDAIVAVLDTGLMFDHPDIKPAGNLLPGFDFVRSSPLTGIDSGDGNGWDNDATDPGDQCARQGINASWHGTHVAGTIGAAATNNGIGIAGVGSKLSVVPVRVLGRCGGTIADIAAGMRWAAGLPVPNVPANAHPADVINMSLGLALPCVASNVGVWIDAIKAIRDAGVVIVAAAGNEDADVKTASPGGCTDVISVAASDRRGHLAPYSNYGDVTIMGPGGDVTRDDDGDGERDGVWSLVAPSADNPDGIAAYEGTSMAAPHVAAAIALAIGKRPELKRKPDIIMQAVTNAAVSPPAGACLPAKPCGPGQLDAIKLLNR